MNAIPSALKVRTPAWSLQAVKEWFQKHSVSSAFESIYLQRNRYDSTIPFLDSLEVPYLYIDYDLVIVECASHELSEKLNRLGFKSLVDLCPKTVKFKKVINKCSKLFFDRVYHERYNIEMFLIHQEDWHDINLTKSIVDEIKIPKSHYFDNFIKIYRKLKA